MKTNVFASPAQEERLLAEQRVLLAAGHAVPALVDGRSAPWQKNMGRHRYDRTIIRPTPPEQAASVDRMIVEANDDLAHKRAELNEATIRRMYEYQVRRDHAQPGDGSIESDENQLVEDLIELVRWF